MFYTVNLVLNTAHTVVAGSKLEKEIIKTRSKLVIVKGHFHEVFETTEEAKTKMALLMLHGTQS